MRQQELSAGGSIEAADKNPRRLTDDGAESRRRDPFESRSEAVQSDKDNEGRDPAGQRRADSRSTLRSGASGQPSSLRISSEHEASAHLDGSSGEGAGRRV